MQEGERGWLSWNSICARVVGQDEAIKAVSNAVRRARAGLGPKPSTRIVHFSDPLCQ
jgi:ATP-dependent Clp protease ATP-binding subunit ClpA